MGKSERPGDSKPARRGRLYELEVSLIAGHVTEEFYKANPVVSRTIQIRGNQTLRALHEAIFEAYDRYDDHLYEFQLGGRKPMDRNARTYGLPIQGPLDFLEENPMAGSVIKTRIDDLDLHPRQVFFYWFDFGDDWLHKIAVKAICDEIPPGHYPRVTQRVGQSPPQYAGMDEEGDEEEGDWDEDEEE